MNSQLLENPFHYKFPRIEHIDDVLPHIKNCDEIVVAERGLYKVINYVGMSGDLFRPPHHIGRCPLMGLGKVSRRKWEEEFTGKWELSHESAIRRECRGMIFDRSGKIVRRPYHKFFNLNEREETLEYHVDLTRGHRILQKLDGSKISTFKLSDEVLRFGTKMGETPICEPAKEFFTQASPWTRLSNEMINVGWTPIFEWCTPENQIVIYYDKPQLVLTAIRQMITGQYMDYNELVDIAVMFGVPYVSEIVGADTGISEWMSLVKEQVDDEGIVICFDDGMRIKVKSDWYVAIHKMKDHILYERNVIPLILEEKIDDVLPHLTDQDRKRITEYVDSMTLAFNESATRVESSVLNVIAHGWSKKEYAQQRSAKDGAFKSIVFSFMDRNRDPQTGLYPTMDFRRYVRDRMKEFWINQCISNSKLAEFKNQNKINTGWR